MNIDLQFKDSSPVETVERIRSILTSQGIEVEENWFDSGVKGCFCLRVMVKGADFGSNGKGVTKELARASGYAELMERMQAGYVRRQYFRKSVLSYADAETVSVDQLDARCGEWIKQIAEGISEQFSTPFSYDCVCKKIIEADAADGKTIRLLPFLDATEGTMTYFPQKIVSSLYSTSGLAAGNNFDEAIVQGFSEIIERRNVIRAFFRDVTPPTIPDEYLAQFTNAYSTIRFLRENGLDVTVKDCSFGEPYPILAVVAIDKEHHSYQVRMGAHPVFEIAIERCLTEMFQGHSLKNAADVSELFIGDAKTRSVSELVGLLTKGYGKYSSYFFSGTPSYAFNPFPDRTNMTNRQLVQEILSYVKSQGHHLLIRSVAHFGFPSIRIIIPGFSEALPNQMLDTFPHLYLLQKYETAALNVSKLDDSSKHEYLQFLKHQQSCYGQSGFSFQTISGMNVFGTSQSRNMFYGQMLFAYLAWDENKTESVRYAKNALQAATPQEKSYLSCLLSICEFLRQSKSISEIQSLLAPFYPEAILWPLIVCIDCARNPFEPLTLHCTKTECASCRFAATCRIVNTQKMINTIQAATDAYDNSSAFAELRKTCK